MSANTPIAAALETITPEYIKSLQTALNAFAPIDLTERSEAALQDRKDTKLTIPALALPQLLNQLTPYYRVLEVNQHRLCAYESLYFDTPNLDLYYHHLNGHLNRHKVRFRRYTANGVVFFELKFKNNKKRTIKIREPFSQIDTQITADHLPFLDDIASINPAELQAQMWVYFYRISLVSLDANERATIDVGLKFNAFDSKNAVGLPNICIIEVKRPSVGVRSPLLQLVYDTLPHSKSISKYVLGMCKLHPTLKQNRLKPYFLAINKLFNEHAANYTT